MGTCIPASPLRYPGGKQCLAPFLRALIEGNDMERCVYAEPYAGGAGLALRLLMDGVVGHILLNDKCPMVATFWNVLFRDTEELLRCVNDTPVTMGEWHHTRTVIQHSERHSPAEVAFAFFFQNRTNFSGVIDGGVIGGKAQAGKYKLDARYPKPRLLALIERVATLRDRVQVFNQDALDFMRLAVLPLGLKCFTYCDPPYYVKGKDLYMNAYLRADHERVSCFLQNCPAEMRWMVSYDNVSEIVEIYHHAQLYCFDLPYSAHVKRKGKELLALPSTLNLPEDAISLVGLEPVLRETALPA